jgi:hypothetical protein
MEPPKLIEPGVKYHLYNTLSKCHETRVGVYTWIFNIVIFAGFVVMFGTALYYCYKNKLSPEEKYNKMMKDQAYILSKIRFYQNERVNMPLSSLTSLPVLQERKV